MKLLTTIFLAVAFATFASAQMKMDHGTAAKSAAGAKYWNANQAKWIDSKDIPGLHEAIVSGDPAKGASIIYLKFDAGTKVPWHWHTGPEIIYGDAGDLQVGMLKSSETSHVTGGSYARMPGHMIHNAECVSKEPCTAYIESPQIFDYHPVDENGKEIKPAAGKSGK
jgi:quercetin dioxygenase-like cupin family protein